MIIENFSALSLYFICILLPGWLLCSFIPIQERYMRLAISYGIGTAVLTGEVFFYFFILRFNFSFWLYIIIFLQAIICLLCILYWKKKSLKKIHNQAEKNIKDWKFKEFVVATLIGICVFFSLLQALVKPPVAYDAIANWSQRSKILVRDGKIDFNPLSDIYLGVPATASYPWHTSLSEYWLRQLGGGEISVNIIPFGYYICIILILYFGLSRKINHFSSLVLVFLFSSMPLISYHSFNTYADLPLTYFVSIAGVLFACWLREKKSSILFFSAFFIGWGIFVKNDGLFAAIAWLVSILLMMYLDRTIISRREFLKTLGFLFGPIIFWLGFKQTLHLGFSSFSLSNNLHPEVLSSLVTTLFVHNSWNIWWFIFFIIVVLKLKYIHSHRELWSLCLFFIVVFILIISVFLFTEYYQYALNFTAIERTIIPLIPISILLVGLTLEERDKVAA